MKKIDWRSAMYRMHDIGTLVGVPVTVSWYGWSEEQREAYTEANVALMRLKRIALKLQRLHEQACNGIPCHIKLPDGRYIVGSRWEDADQEKNDAECAKLMVRAEKLAAPFGWTVEEQGDPRGGALYLKDAEGRDLGHVLYF